MSYYAHEAFVFESTKERMEEERWEQVQETLSRQLHREASNIEVNGLLRFFGFTDDASLVTDEEVHDRIASEAEAAECDDAYPRERY